MGGHRGHDRALPRRSWVGRVPFRFLDLFQRRKRRRRPVRPARGRGVSVTGLPPAPENWDIDRLTAERTEAVTAFGFTERQARFLVEVLIHSGVFVERQYCAFAGITHGQKTHDFLR